MVVILNSTLQVFLKVSLLNIIFQLTNISMDAVSSIKSFLLGSVWFNIYHCFNRFLYMHNISHATEQKILLIAYRNPILCTYVLHKRHGKFFGTYSQILFLNNVRDNIF